MNLLSRPRLIFLVTLFLVSTLLLTQFSDAASSKDENEGKAKTKEKGKGKKGEEDSDKQQCSSKDGNKTGGCRNETRLVLVQVIFRHGDRTPLYSWPKDPNSYKKSNNSMAKAFQRKGLLTKRGKVQAYELGTFLATRYKEFLTGSWIPEDIHVQSSETDRTMMTAQTLLAGLFPPSQCSDTEPGGCEGRWSREIRWQPIPIYSIPKKLDNKINFHRESCPAYMAEVQKVLSCDYMQQYITNNQKMFEDLKENTGLPEVGIENVGLIYDTLYVQKSYEMPLPNWTKPYFPSPLKEMEELGFQALSANREMMRYYGGPLLKEVITNMKKTAIKRCIETQQKKEEKKQGRNDDDEYDMSEMMFAQKPRRKKMYLYSGHDTTVAALLATLGLLHQHQPAYASAVIVELHEPIKKKGGAESTNEFIVKVFYRNASRNPVQEMNMLRCGNPCHLDNLEMMSSDIFVANWQKECEGRTGLMAMLMQPIKRVMNVCMKIISSLFSFQGEAGGGVCLCKK